MDQSTDVQSQGPEFRAPWRMLRRGGKAKVAFSIRELTEMTSAFSLKHVNDGCTATSIRTNHEKFLLVYKVVCSESYSDPKGHTVKMKFDFRRLRVTGEADDLDVRVSCSCPAFLWWGAQWNLAEGKSLYGEPRPLLKAPTDPERYKFVVCKHIKVVSDRITPVLDSMLARYRTKEDKAIDEAYKQQIELVKQQVEQDVERKKKELKPPPAPLPATDDLDAMPEKPEDIGLPPKPLESEKPKRKPITPKVKVPPVVQPEPAPQPTPSNVTLVDEDEGTTTLPSGRKHPSNIKLVHDDSDETTTILPGTKARPMLEDMGLSAGEAVEERGRKAPKKRSPAAPRPKLLPPNIQLIDDDSDDQVTKINRLLKARMAALALAQEA